MDPDRTGKPCPETAGLVLALAKAFHWAGLYGTDHPVLAKRVGETHSALLARLASEPAQQLLLGIARDKVLYRDQFLGAGQELVVRLTESLYLRQVATVGFGPQVTPAHLLSLFRYLHDSQRGETQIAPQEFLRRNGILGIRLSPYNYKELLSRTLAEPDREPGEGEKREEELWRILLTSDFTEDRDGDRKVLDEMMEYPEMFQAVLRRARETGGATQAAAVSGDEGAVSPEVLQRIFRRAGTLLRSLPEDRRRQVLARMQAGTDRTEAEPGDEASPIDVLVARSLTTEYSDDEFLDLLATLLAVEGKAGERLRQVFAIIAVDRNTEGSLAEKAGARTRQSRKAKNYYELKTWETVEKLLLARSESAYLGKEHSRFLESISAARKPTAAPLRGSSQDDPVLRDCLKDEEMRRRSAVIHLELLAGEHNDEEFFDLLEEVRKALPNLISRKDVHLLATVLGSLDSLAASVPDERQRAVRRVIADTDFGQIAGLCLSGEQEEGGAREIRDLLGKFGSVAAPPILDLLLAEPESSKRRTLIGIASRLGPAAVPEMLDRLSHPKWYLVRNLCIVLGEIGDHRAVPGLLQAASHADPRVRREAILAVGRIGAQEAVPGLGRILLEEGLFSSAKEDRVRIDAAGALYRIGGAQAVAFLHKGKGVRRKAVRTHCEELLRSLEPVR